jgi:tetratricopeptide (TPR) repeat protein
MSVPPGFILSLTIALGAPAPRDLTAPLVGRGLQPPPQAPSNPAPPLPRLALETFPPASREPISRHYEQAMARPKDDEASGALGRQLHAWEQWEAAHDAYTRAATLAPSRFDWHYLDAIVLQRLARHRDAADALRRALAADSQYLPARVRLAEALLDSGGLQQSRPLFESLTSVTAAEPAALVGLGRIAAIEGRHDEAIRRFERAVGLFPELGAAYYGLARSYRAVGRSADAERAVAQQARFGSRWPRIEDPILASVAALREDARATLQRGIALAETGDVPGAIDAHHAALARDASLTQAHANLVGLYGRAGNWARAEEHYKASVAQGVGGAELHYDYAVVLGLQGQWDGAADAYRRALSVNPLHAHARNNLGQVLERRRDFDAAIAQYRQAVEAQPTFRLGRFNLGRMLLVKGQTDQAILEFEKLRQPVDPETPRYLFALSTALVRARKVADGVRIAGEARDLALRFGQTEFAKAIASELEKLK